MSESRIDKLKRAAVRLQSLEGRYDPAPHTDHCDSNEGVNIQRAFQITQGNLLLDEGDNHPLLFCVC